ncbi:MAG: hypothetical protein QOH41_833 [Blastocatellia bacterium]|jgi:hypothetical protein|nr:hypothetical protein [Blastocatellia bacterium]
MKRCPQCNRTYTDDALSFCLDDGSPLLSTGGPAPSDPSATIQYPQARDTSPQATIAFNPGQAPPPPTPPPSWNPMPPPGPQKRSVWPWLLGIGAVLVFLAIGVVILIFAVASITNDNNNNKGNANNSNRVVNKNTNKNTNGDETNTNANSRSSLTSFTDDFSNKTWGVGESQFGNIAYQDEEYHMHATKGGFIVMYAPDKPEYKTENATVRVGLRSIDGDPPSTGYGVVVHGEKKDGKLEDYGFLIYNGEGPKYKIVLHKAGAETKVVDWTPTSTIRTGTSPNQVEVRIRDLKMDFYINGQFVTSITDEANYRRGRVGLYTSDVGEVAFDDLEISR